MAETFTFTIKPIADLSDVRANVGEIQKAFSKLKLPPKLGVNLSNELNNFITAYDKFTEKQNRGIKNNSDVSGLMKASDSMLSSYKKITELMKQVDDSTITNVFKLEGEEIEKFQQKLVTALQNLSKYQSQLDNFEFKGTDKVLDSINQLEKKTRSTSVKGYLNNLRIGIEKKDFDDAKNAIEELKAAVTSPDIKLSPNTEKSINELVAAVEPTVNKFMNLREKAEKAGKVIKEIDGKPVEAFSKYLEQGNEALEKNAVNAEKAGKAEAEFNKEVSHLENQVESYFGLNAIFRKVADMARQAMETVKELDKAMTETAVVTDFSISDMWEKLPIYTAEANKLGSTIKDVYEATTLYYQQGLNTAQSMGLAEETLKMARIAGMEAKDATDAMTAALRGFNLEINQTSAKRINDVYSELAAITASNTQEISTAMEKVASLAHNAGMEVETTSAFLAQMIETTREAPENLGTALKTVVARFQEMKQDPTKLVDSEGVMLDANKVDKALKSIGVNLLDVNGEFRKLDDVFLEIASKWDSLSKGQQRYIATIAAGSRQQSRFIAMMSDYSRTMELVNAANDAAGASQKQFEKTLESMDTKLNQLQNAWNQFTMGLMNNEILKAAVDAGTQILDVVNKIINAVSNLIPGNKGLNKTLLTLIATFNALSGARGFLKTGISSGVKWFKGDLSTGGLFKNLLFSGRDNIRSQFQKAGIGKVGTEAGKEVAINFRNSFQYSIRGFSGIFHDVLSKEIQGGLKTGLLQSMDTEVLRKNILNNINEKNTPSWDPLQANQEDLIKFARDNRMESAVTGISKLNIAMGQFGVGTIQAGSALQSFGLILRGTPLAPFGMALQTAGVALSSFGKLLITVDAQGKITGAGFKALWNNIGGWTGVGIAAAALAIWGIYRAATASKRELQDLSKVAQSASEHLDTTKQNANEFKTTLEQIKENNDAFKGLVPGTLAFNEKLVESNQLILSLVEKFDELRDKLQIDEYGRYFFNENDLNDFYKNLVDKEGIAAGVALLTDLAVAEKKLEIENDKLNQSNKEFVGNKYTYGKDGTREYSKEYAAYLKTQEKNTEKQTQSQLEYDTQKQRDVRNALRNSFTGLDISDAETAAEVMADTYYDSYVDRVQKNFSDKDLVELYATQNGENFDEIWDDKESKKAAIKEGRFIAILHEARSEAEEVDKSLQILNKTAEKVFDTKYGDTSSTFTDLFTGNGENLSEELIEDLYNAPEKVEKIVKQIGETSLESLRALMPDFEGTADELMGAVTKKITNNISSIMAVQTEIYQTTAVWYAKLFKKWNASQAGVLSKSLATQITQNFSVKTAKSINSFLDQASQAFSQADFSFIGEKLFTELDKTLPAEQEKISELLTQIDWSSAIERGQLYQEFGEGSEGFKKLDKHGRNFIKTITKVDKKTDIIGKQFQELVQSSDFLEIYSEKWKDFANETGYIDSDGVEKMAEECSTLADLLELDELKASTLATALNYFNDIGNFDGLTGAVLLAIDEFNSLDGLVAQVKKDIENFQPGEDYTQGVDAYRNYYKTLKEGNENHKFSSEDTLKAFYQFIPEEDEIKYIKKHGGDRAKAQQALLKQLDFLESENEEDSTLSILNKLVSGKKLINLGGKSTYDSKGKFEFSNINGMLNVDAKDLTRDEFINQMVKSGAMPTEEMARGFLLSLEGMDIGRVIGDEFVSLTSQLNENGRGRGIEKFIKGLEDRELIDSKRTSEINGQNQLVISDAELRALKETGGYKNIKEVREALAKELNISVEHIRSFNEETESVNKYLKKRFGEEGTNKERATRFLDETKDATTGVVDFNKATEELEKSGISATKALDMAIDMAHKAGVEQVKWGEDLIPVSDIINGEQFNEAVDKLEDEAKWATVGEKIGEAVATVLHEHGIGKEPEQSTQPAFTASEVTHGNRAEFDQLDPVTQEIEMVADNASVISALYEVNQEIDDTKTQISNLQTKIKEPTKFDLNDQEVKEAKIELTQLKNKLNELKATKITITASVHTNINDSAKPENAAPAYKGRNNYISPSGFYTGSMARGNGKGTLGPKGKGGLTLTGEEGFEVAWLPSENRSMILGAHGPQMTNLPADAVVWNHKQSKRIVAQKGIPLGSMGNGDVPAGGMYYTSVTAWQTAIKANTQAIQDSTKQNKDKPKKTKTDNSNKKRTDWLEVENERYNLNRHINVITQKIEKQASKIDKTLEKIGVTYKEVEKLTKKQIKNIDNEIKYQEQLKETYINGLKQLNTGDRKLTVNLQSKVYDKEQKKNVWKSDDVQIDTKDYIKKENGVYVLNRDKINDDFKGSNREIVSNALQSELDKLTSGASNAAKAIEDLNDKREQLTKSLAETFYLWENELTEVYQKTLEIEQAESQRSRYENELAFNLARLNVGSVSLSKAIQQLTFFREKEFNSVKNKINLQKELIKAEEAELEVLANPQRGIKKQQAILNDPKADKAEKKAAEIRLESLKVANKYISTTPLKDGTYKIEVDYKKIAKDIEKGRITNTTGEDLKQYADELKDANINVSNSRAEMSDLLTEPFEQLREDWETLADLEEQLLDSLEKAAQKEIDRLESLNTSLTNATKSIIEQVKKSIDARRRSEDNAKTESDISRKQQRLAALRANTAGGNQVEIAQLEKEIADAQQSYGRTLEDQLLNNIQSQADEAAKQRQEQIGIAKQQLEWNKSQGVFRDQVDTLIKNIGTPAGQQAIKDALSENETKVETYWSSKIKETDLETTIANGAAAKSGIAGANAFIESEDFQKLKDSVIKNDKKAEEVDTKKIANEANKAIADVNKELAKAKNGQSQAEAGVAAAKSALHMAQATGNSVEITQATQNLNQARTQLTQASQEVNGLEKEKEGYEANTHARGKLKSLPAEKLTKKSDIKKLQEGLNDLIDDGQITGVSKINNPQGKGGPKTQAAVKALQKKLGRKETGEWNKKTAEDLRKHKRLKYYVTGGLADYTGPAWLDGTPSKPELVLNAQDTKNFMALKDILSGAIRSINHVDSTNNYNSPTEVNINVNVDKIANDYDVDKLTERIKKNIVKDASYRNVTSVRNLR